MSEIKLLTTSDVNNKTSVMIVSGEEKIYGIIDQYNDGYLEVTLTSKNEQIKKFGGFDHNFVLKGRGFRKVGEFKGDKTGIIMEIYTDQSGMQIYSGNMIEEGRVCKDGVIYSKHHGICFETQAFPNALKYSHFPDVVLRKGEKYDTTTSYRFI